MITRRLTPPLKECRSFEMGQERKAMGRKGVAEVGALLLWWKSGGGLAYILDINVFRIRAYTAASVCWWGWNWRPWIHLQFRRQALQPLCLKRVYPWTLTLRAWVLFPCSSLANKVKKQIRVGDGSSNNGIDWWWPRRGEVDRCSYTFVFRSSWVGVFTGPEMGEDSLLVSNWEKWPD